MAKREAVTAAQLLKGEGALTAQEVDALTSECRTAQTAIDGQTFKVARVAYVLASRGGMDADGTLVAQKDLAAKVGLTPAAISQYKAQIGYLLLAGFDLASESRAGGWAKVWNLAVALRKLSPGRDKAKQDDFQQAVTDALQDVAMVDDSDRTGALTATIADLKEVAKVLRAEPSATGEAQTTPETSGEKALTGKSDIISAIAAIAEKVQTEGFALTNSESAQVARYLAMIAANLGVDADEMAADAMNLRDEMATV